MGFAHFIARRILSDRDRQDRLSRPIVLIAILGIVIGMAVMILTVGISTGFQGEVRAKVTGAGAHIEIAPLTQSDVNESSRVRIAQPFYPWLDTVPGIAHIQVFALKPGIVIGMAVMILTVGISTGFQGEVRAKVTGAGAHIEIAPLTQSDVNESTRVRIAQSFYPWLDTVPGIEHIQVFALKPGIVETAQDIQGVVVKGVGADHDWTFIRKHLLAGTVLSIGDSVRPQVLISNWMAKRLQLGIGDDLTVYLIKGREDIRPRKYKVTGIYETGLEKVDHQVVYVDIAHIQRFAQWGLQAEIAVSEPKSGSGISVEALGFGGDGDFSYEWPGTSLHGKGPHTVCVKGDTTLMLVVHDNGGTLPDTAWIDIHPTVLSDQLCQAEENLLITRRSSGGSYKDYCGGFEVSLNDYRDLATMDDLIYRDYLGAGLRTITVRQKFPEIFSWLELLDTNVIVVILLMVIVAIINMTSALLIIILERTNMIGVLKALGTGNRTIRRIFLIDAAYIMGIGIILGDVLGIGLALIQKQFGLARLPIESYYVDQVPVDLSPWPIIALNIGVLVVCVLALVLPSMYVSRIAPAKAIRFE